MHPVALGPVLYKSAVPVGQNYRHTSGNKSTKYTRKFDYTIPYNVSVLQVSQASAFIFEY